MTTEEPRPFSIKIFVAEGSASGLKFVEKSNWSGHGFVCPRPRFSTVKIRREFQQAGVYLITGPSESGELPIAYIGEGDPIKARLEDHHSKQEFWTVAYGFVGKDSNLNKAHIQYLEFRLLGLAREAKRCILKNANKPTEPSLSESDRSVKDTIAIAERLERCGANLASLSERLDSTSAMGKMVFRLLSTLNEFERDQLAERTASAMAHLRKATLAPRPLVPGERLANRVRRDRVSLASRAPFDPRPSVILILHRVAVVAARRHLGASDPSVVGVVTP